MAMTGMDGARVRLPSGRWLDQLTDLAGITNDEAAYIVAMYMISHAREGVFRGSIGTALKNTWPGQNPNQPHLSHLGRKLKRYGFRPEQTPEGFRWHVPEAMPVWESTDARSSSYDDGSQTTGGPVVVRQLRPPVDSSADTKPWTRTMVQLLAAIRADPARHPRDYAAQLGWTHPDGDLAGDRVSSVAASLRARGYVESKGERSAARYYPTDVELPPKVQRKMRALGRGRAAPRAAGPVEPSTATSGPPTPPTTPPPVAAPPGPGGLDPELVALGRILELLGQLSPASREYLVARLQGAS